MARRGSSMRQAFPLASGSRARRRLLMNQGGETEPDTPEAVVQLLQTVPDASVESLLGDDVADILAAAEFATAEEAAAPPAIDGIPEDLRRQVKQADRTESIAAEIARTEAPPSSPSAPEPEPPDSAPRRDTIPVHDQAFTRPLLPREESGSRVPSFRQVRRLLEGNVPVTWIFTGDSITHGAEHTGGRRSFPEHFSERVRWELRRFLDVVINTGVAGETAPGLLKNLQWRALRFQPDVVSVLIGMNDATHGPSGRSRFRKSLRQIIEEIRSAGAIPLLHTPNRIDMDRVHSHSDLRVYVKMIRDIAVDQGVPCFDHWGHWKDARPDGDIRRWLADDGIHPAGPGHREMARLMFRMLGIYEDTSPTCRNEK